MHALTLELEKNISYEIYRCQITDTYLLIFIMDMLFLVSHFLSRVFVEICYQKSRLFPDHLPQILTFS